MGFWIFVAGIFVLCFSYPYIRCFFKRLFLRNRIVKACARKGYILHPTRPLWWCGSKSRHTCDCYIETSSTLFSIKLFGMSRYNDTLIFTKEKKWFVRHYIGFISSIGTSLKLPVDGRLHNIYDYNFRYKFQTDWHLKTPRNILLLHPTCHEIRRKAVNGKEVIIGAGDTVGLAEIYSSSRFLGLLGGEL